MFQRPTSTVTAVRTGQEPKDYSEQLEKIRSMFPLLQTAVEAIEANDDINTNSIKDGLTEIKEKTQESNVALQTLIDTNASNGKAIKDELEKAKDEYLKEIQKFQDLLGDQFSSVTEILNSQLDGLGQKIIDNKTAIGTAANNIVTEIDELQEQLAKQHEIETNRLEHLIWNTGRKPIMTASKVIDRSQGGHTVVIQENSFSIKVLYDKDLTDFDEDGNRITSLEDVQIIVNGKITNVPTNYPITIGGDINQKRAKHTIVFPATINGHIPMQKCFIFAEYVESALTGDEITVIPDSIEISSPEAPSTTDGSADL